jgi:hypothetical protein
MVNYENPFDVGEDAKFGHFFLQRQARDVRGSAENKTP